MALNICFFIIAHPHKLLKDSTGNYPCPDVFEIADGAMWNNKMDNILIYHRPNHQLDSNSTVCELHTKKIRKQKIVGKKGTLVFDLDRAKRRYLFNGIDYFEKQVSTLQPNINFFELEKTEEIIYKTEAPF